MGFKEQWREMCAEIDETLIGGLRLAAIIGAGLGVLYVVVRFANWAWYN